MVGKKILVVDDDESFRELMVSHLQKKGFKVEGAQDGHYAIQLLRSHGPYAILVTDMMMPGISGLELLRFAKKFDSDLEVIVITASGSVEAAISALREDGAFDFLTKPLGMMAELSIAVDRALRYRDLRSEREVLNHRRAEEADRIHSILAATREAVLAVDSDENLELANKKAEIYLTERKAGLKIMDILPDDIAAIVRGWKETFKQETARVTAFLPGYGVIHIDLSTLHTASGDPDGWVMTIRTRDYEPVSKKYSENLLAELDEMIGVQAGLVKSLSGFSRFTGMQTPEARKQLGTAAAYLKKLDQSTHKVKSAIKLYRCSPEHQPAGVLAAGPFVDLKDLLGKTEYSSDGTVHWHIPERISPIKAAPNLIWQAVRAFHMQNGEEEAQEKATIVTAEEAAGWVWLDLVDASPKAKNGSRSVDYSICNETLTQIVVDRLGGQYWQYADENHAHIALTFPVS
ncbi:MAG: response regulator [Anaerolineales bacterium]|nr:response regulator [Anaerolineales bacterium]